MFQWRFIKYLSWHNSLWLQWRRTETRRTIRSSSPASHSRTKQTDGEGQKSSKRTVNREESSSDWKCEIPFKFCTKHVMWILSSSRVSELQVWKKDVYMTINVISDMLRQEESPTKVKERGCKRISYDIEGVYRIGLRVSRFLFEKVSSVWTMKIDIKTRRQILQRHVTSKKKSGNKGSIARKYPKVCVSWA